MKEDFNTPMIVGGLLGILLSVSLIVLGIF